MLKLVESGSSPLVARGKLLSGPFATLGKKNKNGRTYPQSIYEEAYKEILPKLKTNSLLGECDHPLNYDEVRLANVSHVVKECRINSNGVVEGTVELLDTPAGKVVQSLVEAGVPIGISSRGLGDTKRTMDGDEVTKFKLITFDLVAEPSFSEAVLTETKKKSLDESLRSIESALPLRESASNDSAPVKGMIRQIRESLLTSTSRHEEFNIDQIELTAVKKLAEASGVLLKRRTEQIRRLNTELASLKSEAARLKESLTSKKLAFSSLESNMSKLQDDYNRISETTVPKSKVDILQKQLTETLKMLEVEKRGMSYSQVGRILEGLTTQEEISAKLDSLIATRRRVSGIEKEDAAPLRESVAPQKNRRLSNIVSNV